MKPIARLLAFLSAAPTSLLYVRIRAPITPLRGTLWILRLLAEALTPFIVLSGAVAAALGLLARSPMAIFTAMLGTVAAVRDVRQVRAPHPGFAQAFGVGAGYCARAAERDAAAPMELASACGARATLATRCALLDPS